MMLIICLTISVWHYTVQIHSVSYPFPVSKQAVYCSYRDLILLHFAIRCIGMVRFSRYSIISYRITKSHIQIDLCSGGGLRVLCPCGGNPLLGAATHLFPTLRSGTSQILHGGSIYSTEVSRCHN